MVEHPVKHNSLAIPSSIQFVRLNLQFIEDEACIEKTDSCD